MQRHLLLSDLGLLFFFATATTKPAACDVTKSQVKPKLEGDCNCRWVTNHENLKTFFICYDKDGNCVSLIFTTSVDPLAFKFDRVKKTDLPFKMLGISWQPNHSFKRIARKLPPLETSTFGTRNIVQLSIKSMNKRMVSSNQCGFGDYD